MKDLAPPPDLASEHEEDAILLTDEVSLAESDDDVILLTGELPSVESDDDAILLTDKAPLMETDDSFILLMDEISSIEADDDVILLTDETPLTEAGGAAVLPVDTPPLPKTGDSDLLLTDALSSGADETDAVLSMDDHWATPLQDEDVIDFSDIPVMTPDTSEDRKSVNMDVIDLGDAIEPGDTFVEFTAPEASETVKIQPDSVQTEDVAGKRLFEPDTSDISLSSIEDDHSHLADISIESHPDTASEFIHDHAALDLETPPVPGHKHDVIESMRLPADGSESLEKFDDLQSMFDEIIRVSPLSPDSPQTESPAEPPPPKDDRIVSEPASPEVVLTEAHITVAVEQVIQKMFAGKIEDMLKTLLTEAVAREMDTMKSTLLEYLGSAHIRKPE